MPRAVLHRLCLGLSLAVGLSLTACEGQREIQTWQPSEHQQPPTDPERTPTTPGSSSDPTHGSAPSMEEMAGAVFRHSCGGCHGSDGRGSGPELPPGAVAPDFTSAEFQASRTDEELATVLRDGRGVMPGYGQTLSEQGIQVLVGYVRSLRRP